MSSVLGISCLRHDAAVAVVNDGEIAFAAHAERYSRRKNDPYLSEAIVRDATQHAASPIETIAFYERNLARRTRNVRAQQWWRAFRDPRPGDYLHGFAGLRGIPIEQVPHHRCHAAATFLTSGWSSADVLVVDGIGEWTTTSVWEGTDSGLRLRRRLLYPHSLGLLYGACTQRAGLRPNEDEHVLMAMAALGDPAAEPELRRALIRHPMPRLRVRRNLHRGLPARVLPDIRAVDLAAAAQELLTNELLALQSWIRRGSPRARLAYGGGVALNCCANTRLARSRAHDEIWIMPCPGDAGAALGAALALEARHAPWTGPFLGHGISRPPDLDAGLRFLLAGEPLALAHGRAEFGPRALGNRSLLIDPRLPDGKDRLNAIKGRQPFRPFAAAVLERHADDWFDLPVRRSPYMQYAVPARRPHEIPAAIHVDGTSRVQTVSVDDNRVLHELLTRFHDATGVPILVNTSLNSRREPLVNSWADASAFAEREHVALA